MRFVSDVQSKDFLKESHHGKLDKINTITKAIVHAIFSRKKPHRKRCHIKLRDGAFNQAIACIEAHAGDHLTVSGLEKSTGVTERTLEYVFRERLGMGPKAYIRTFRLNRVRRDLIRSNPSAVKVVDIANSWGFWHMGQFSKDYRELFKELPSATLRDCAL